MEAVEENDLGSGVSAHEVESVDLRHKSLNSTDFHNSVRLFRNARVLFAGFNFIESLPLKLPTRLVLLDLSNNRIQTLHGFEQLKQLEILDVSQNLLTHCVGLENPNLRALYLAGNQIRRLDGLENLRRLECLELQQNNVQRIAELRVLSILPRLKVLHINGNPVAKNPNIRHRLRHILPHLEELDDWGLSSTSGRRRKADDTKSTSDTVLIKPPPQADPMAHLVWDRRPKAVISSYTFIHGNGRQTASESPPIVEAISRSSTMESILSVGTFPPASRRALGTESPDAQRPLDDRRASLAQRLKSEQYQVKSATSPSRSAGRRRSSFMAQRSYFVPDVASGALSPETQNAVLKRIQMNGNWSPSMLGDTTTSGSRASEAATQTLEEQRANELPITEDLTQAAQWTVDPFRDESGTSATKEEVHEHRESSSYRHSESSSTPAGATKEVKASMWESASGQHLNVEEDQTKESESNQSIQAPLAQAAPNAKDLEISGKIGELQRIIQWKQRNLASMQNERPGNKGESQTVMDERRHAKDIQNLRYLIARNEGNFVRG